ncbi:MAG: CYTH domain-containing protein [Prevotella sp.]|nr:CYTH domain-containing protein [Prevotella sp.]
MSGLEIERKFLVHKQTDWKHHASSCSHIQQGYFAAINTVRVRIRDDKGYLTIKGPSRNGGMTRYEFEKEISLQEAEQLMQLCEPGVVDKHRYIVEHAGHTFEIDEFHGDNAGLVMAEVELGSENEQFDKPDFIGQEVTGDRRFYNSHMRGNPFKLWRDTLPEEYR